MPAPAPASSAPHVPLDMGVRVRLSTMMFLQYFVWGSWIVTLANYLSNLKIPGPQIGLAYGTGAIAGMVSPFVVGMIADRYFATQRILAVLHLLGAGLMFALTLAREFPLIYVMLLAYYLCYMPTLALTNSLSFHNLSNAERQFPGIRVLGTIGWIVAGILIGVFKIRGTPVPMYMAAGGSAVLGLFCLLLPHTPPKNAGKSMSIGDVLGLDALRLLKSRAFAIFVVGSFLVTIPLQFYYTWTEQFLGEIGVQQPSAPSALFQGLQKISMEQPAAMMTFGQMSEFFFMLVMPWFFIRLGVKWMLVVGMACWAIRYTMFAYGNPNDGLGLLFIGILLHGICYDFFFVTGQLYVDRKATPETRGAAQGFIAFVTLGIGGFIGSWISGVVVGGHVTHQVPGADGTMVDVHDWKSIWLIPAAGAAAVMVLFAVSFFDRTDGEAKKT